MAVLLICSILLTICVVKWVYRDKTLYDFADKIPGPKAYPIIGSSHKLLKQKEEGKDFESAYPVHYSCLNFFQSI